MDLSGILITYHALQRFQERWPDDNKLQDPEKTLKKLLTKTREIRKNPVASTLAIIEHKKRARYFENSGWVFVTNEETTTLLTTERRKDRPQIWENNSCRKRRKKSG